MSCNNGLFGGSACSWIVILLILSMCCGNDSGNGCGYTGQTAADNEQIIFFHKYNLLLADIVFSD